MAEIYRNIDSHVSDIDTLNGMTRSLERSEMRSGSSSLLLARKSIARRLGIAAASLENFRALRTKIVPHWLMNRVRAELLQALEMEAKNLEREIQHHRRSRAGDHHDTLDQAETQLAATRKLLRGD